MNSKRILSLIAVVAVLPLVSCSGPTSRSGGGGGGTGNAKVSITLYDTPPTGVSLLSFTLPIAGISLTPSTGSPVAVATTVSSVEATRLQTDSALIADAVSVAAGSYKTISVTLGPTSATSNVFVNTSGASITYSLNGSSFTCTNDSVCNLPAGAVYTVAIPLTLTLSSNQNQWIGLNLNLNNAITTSGGLAVDFSQSGVLTATTTVRTGIPSSAADTIEDFVGVVTAYTSGSSITVQSGISGQKITAVLNSSTEYDTPLNGSTYTNCTAASAQACISVGSTVSVDTTLSSAGVLTATEVDVLDTKQVDEVEGIIYATSTANVFGLILADKVSASGNSVLGASTTTYGTGISLNIGSVSNYLIDTKTLTTAPSFTPVGFTSSADLLDGQMVRAQVSSVTSSSSGISATAKALLLRYSRLTGAPTNVTGTSFNFTPPSYITSGNVGLSASPLAYTYSTTAFDGVTDTSGLANASTVAIRTLFWNNAQPQFAVAKVRVP